MPRVLIECPATGRMIYTGINLSWQTFEAYRIGEKSVPCPQCGATHIWGRVDAELDESGGYN